MADIYRKYREVNEQHDTDMIWSIFPSRDELTHDTSIELVNVGAGVADGEYYVYFDDPQLLAGGVNVIGGMFDTASTLRAVQFVRDADGYWGEFLERLTWDPEVNAFRASIGS